jgi:hypothetical protein
MGIGGVSGCVTNLPISSINCCASRSTSRQQSAHVRLAIAPIPLAGPAETPKLFLDFDAKSVDELIGRLTILCTILCARKLASTTEARGDAAVGLQAAELLEVDYRSKTFSCSVCGQRRIAFASNCPTSEHGISVALSSAADLRSPAV